MSGYFWTEKEIEFLKKNYKKISNKQIGIRLGRSLDATRMKISHLGLSSPDVLKRKCEYCGKQFTTKDKTQKYCSKECRYEQFKIRQHDNFKKREKQIKKKRAEKSELIKKQREQLIASNKKKKDLTTFFRLYCLTIDAYKGIKKIKLFTGREDAEKIYRLLRADFMKSKSI